MTLTPYIGRFAPSPTGPLHAGSLVAALASWLDARAHHGQWLLRIEDIDPPRCPPGMDQEILHQLAAVHLCPDQPPTWQSRRYALYEQALAQLQADDWAYPCGCTRRQIEDAHTQLGLAHERHGERPYPGTCRDGLHGKAARTWRFNTTRYVSYLQAKMAANACQTGAISPFLVADNQLRWHDRLLGDQQQDVAAVVGDFAVRRGDGLWAYQLAVVVDDAAQGITDVLRGADLADNTPRQLLLQSALGLPTPRYIHTPLVLQPDGEKLSKQYGAPAVDTSTPASSMQALQRSAHFLGLQTAPTNDIDTALAGWVPQWAARYLRQAHTAANPNSPI